jgi:hypothetical protein
MNTFSGGLGPAGETSNAILDVFLAQVYNLDFSTGISHPIDKVSKHQFGFALSFTPGAGIKRKYSHDILL